MPRAIERTMRKPRVISPPGERVGGVTRDADVDIIGGVREDDAARKRFEGVFGANSQLVFDYARRRTASLADAADVMAETMLVAWRRIEDVPDGDDERLWLYGVARRQLANHRRGLRRRQRLGQRLRERVGQDQGPVLVDAHGDDSGVGAALALLSGDEQELIRLTSWEGLGGNEIAVMLGISPGSARIRIHRARNRLRDALIGAARPSLDPRIKEGP